MKFNCTELRKLLHIKCRFKPSILLRSQIIFNFISCWTKQDTDSEASEAKSSTICFVLFDLHTNEVMGTYLPLKQSGFLLWLQQSVQSAGTGL